MAVSKTAMQVGFAASQLVIDHEPVEVSELEASILEIGVTVDSMKRAELDESLWSECWGEKGYDSCTMTTVGDIG